MEAPMWFSHEDQTGRLVVAPTGELCFLMYLDSCLRGRGALREKSTCLPFACMSGGRISCLEGPELNKHCGLLRYPECPLLDNWLVKYVGHLGSVLISRTLAQVLRRTRIRESIAVVVFRLWLQQSVNWYWSLLRFLYCGITLYLVEMFRVLCFGLE